MTVELSVQPRAAGERVEALRARGIVPAVVYGHKEAAQSISIDAGTLERIWRSAGETTLIKLTGLAHDMDTLIHDVQIHPVSGQVLHVDFYALEKGKKVEIAVPLEFIGESPAEKAGHVLVKALHEVEIEVAPAELPHTLPVDISTLHEVGDHITASQIVLPKSAVLVTDADEIVISVTEHKEESAEEAAPATEAPAEAAPEAEEASAE